MIGLLVGFDPLRLETDDHGLIKVNYKYLFYDNTTAMAAFRRPA